ncbi:MAG TPA: DUF167 family protein [Pseudolabrys sp.]|nr:DUF167 family protein [Pseudolabrys sp.]
MQRPWHAKTGGVSLRVRLVPRGGRDAIDGIDVLDDGRAVLRARVRAAPSGGEANEALIKLMAKAIGIPPRDIALAGGSTSRLKRLTIFGDSRTLIAALEKICASG